MSEPFFECPDCNADLAIETHKPNCGRTEQMNDVQIKHMVDRFLSWKLPRDSFNPDCGISFNKEPFNVHTDHPMLHEPVGTNLFDAQQAEAMVRYMLEGLPTP